VAFEPLAGCRHVESVGAGENEALTSSGVIEDQLLRNRTALLVAEHSSGVEAQMVEQARQVRSELSSRIRRWKSPTLPMTTHVGNDHAMSGCELLEHRLEHFAGHHQPMHKQERRSRSALGKVEQL
jgi:predicted ATP-dependent serine protease